MRRLCTNATPFNKELEHPRISVHGSPGTNPLWILGEDGSLLKARSSKERKNQERKVRLCGAHVCHLT